MKHTSLKYWDAFKNYYEASEKLSYKVSQIVKSFKYWRREHMHTCQQIGSLDIGQ